MFSSCVAAPNKFPPMLLPINGDGTRPLPREEVWKNSAKDQGH